MIRIFFESSERILSEILIQNPRAAETDATICKERKEGSKNLDSRSE